MEEEAKFKPDSLSKLGPKKQRKTTCKACNCCRVWRATYAVQFKKWRLIEYRRGFRDGERKTKRTLQKSNG